MIIVMIIKIVVIFENADIAIIEILIVIVVVRLLLI